MNRHHNYTTLDNFPDPFGDAEAKARCPITMGMSQQAVNKWKHLALLFLGETLRRNNIAVGTLKVAPKLMCDAIQGADMNEYEKDDQVFKLAPALRREGPVLEVVFGSAGGWEIEIKRLWALRRSSTLELAQVVYAAKLKLHYGQWERLLNSGRLPFAPRTAQMLFAIAQGLGRLEAHNYALLPSALNTLNRLAQLPHAVLVSLIAEGTIHPGLTMSEAKALLAKFKPQRNANRRRLQVKRRISRFREFLLTTLPDWTAEECALVQSELRELLELIANRMNSTHQSQNLAVFAHKTEL